MSFTDAPEFDVDARKRDGAIPRFYTEPLKNNFRSEKEGRPCFDEVEMVEILIPGDRRTTFVGRVNEEHRKRFPREYASFKAGQETPLEGTPIGELPGITRAQAEELIHSHVRTVEALAGLSDDQLSKAVGMGGFALRDRAKRWLDAAAGAAPAEKLAAENEELRGKLSAMEGQMADLLKRMDAMQAKTNSGPEA